MGVLKNTIKELRSLELPRKYRTVLEEEFSIYFEDYIELYYGCSVREFITSIFPELMGESIDEYITRTHRID